MEISVVIHSVNKRKDELESEIDASIFYKYPSFKPSIFVTQDGYVKLRWDSSTRLYFDLNDLEWVQQVAGYLELMKDES
jgi:hypothetical protein